MFETKLIISQKYVQVRNGLKALLVDICGNDAIVELEEGKILKIPTENFKAQFILNTSL